MHNRDIYILLANKCENNLSSNLPTQSRFFLVFLTVTETQIQTHAQLHLTFFQTFQLLKFLNAWHYEPPVRRYIIGN